METGELAGFNPPFNQFSSWIYVRQDSVELRCQNQAVQQRGKLGRRKVVGMQVFVVEVVT